MSKWIRTFMIVVCVALIGVFVYIKASSDIEAPTIHVPETLITYTQGTPYDMLLEGVTAVDDADGDVTTTVQVEAVYPLENNVEANVVYVAKDRANNIATASRKVNYVSVDQDVNLQPEVQQPEVQQPEVMQPEAGIEPIDPVAEEIAAQQAAEEAFAELPSGAPRLTLSATRVQIKAGDEFNALNYVKDITDNRDEKNDLYRSIRVSDEYDTATPGTYEIVYYVVDKDGNSSNKGVLTLIVTE